MDSSLEYACKRLQELERLLLVDVPETVWPAEVSMVFAQIEKAGTLQAHHQRRLQHHINRMWLEKCRKARHFSRRANPTRLLLNSWG